MHTAPKLKINEVKGLNINNCEYSSEMVQYAVNKIIISAALKGLNLNNENYMSSYRQILYHIVFRTKNTGGYWKKMKS